jgi:hypothetical protein
MITYKVTVTEKANQDEEKTFKYISEKFGRVYAENFRKKLIELFTLGEATFYRKAGKKRCNLKGLHF